MKITTLLVLLLTVSAGLTLWSRALERRVRPQIGLLQTVYSTPDFRDPPLLSRRVTAVELVSPGGTPALPQRFFSVRWEGFWDIGQRNEVDVYAGGDDRVELFVDGRAVLERSARNGLHSASRTLHLAQGVHRLKVEYVQYGGDALVNVQWAPAGATARPFLPETLFVEPPDQNSLSTARRAAVLRRATAAAWTTVSMVVFVLVGALSIRQWKRLHFNDRITGTTGRWRAHFSGWAKQYEPVGRIGLALVLGAVTLSACLARLPGLNPESLWYDDLAWAAMTRARDFRSIFLTPTHAPPGFLALLWAFRLLFHDPEWSQQLLPFICGIAAIPVMAVAVRRLTRSDGLALLAAALTALNPLLAHFTVYVKQYSLDFLITALFLLAGASMLDGRTIGPWKFARLAILSWLGLFFSMTSVFVSLPTVNVVALRAWLTRQRGARAALLAAGIFNLLLLVAYFLFRNRSKEVLTYDLHRFIMLSWFSHLWTFLATRGRRVIEMSLPSWNETQIWRPETLSWTLPFVGLGLIWLLARRSTRAMGCVMLGFSTAFLLASYTDLYPLTTDRRSIFAFPVFIYLLIMGLHLLTEWLPSREMLRLALGLSAAGFALHAPIRAEYWPVNDARLIKRASVSLAPADGLILSPNGTSLAAYYGAWPVVIGRAKETAGGTRAGIVRDLTLHLPLRDSKPAVDRFLEQSRPARIWYVAFRTGREDEEEVLKALTEQGYAVEQVERTTRGKLYLGRHPN